MQAFTSLPDACLKHVVSEVGANTSKGKMERGKGFATFLSISSESVIISVCKLEHEL